MRGVEAAHGKSAQVTRIAFGEKRVLKFVLCPETVSDVTEP